ncbi:MAG: RsmE family RNA methyltransferase [Candidatus Komeilibacteria bacterium]|nr:RsmE family RNA methyltransferase [Candidatus Komeilibacteria bacterium]
MKIHRFIGNFDLSKKQLVIREEKLVRQLFLVLKIQKNEQIVLSNGQGQESQATVIKASAKEYLVELTGNQAGVNIHRQVVLYCAVLKKENFELVVQKAAEVGVARIVPIISERTIKLNVNFDRLEKIAQEASEQAGRADVPAIGSTSSLGKALVESKNFDVAIIFNQTGKPMAALQSKLARTKKVAIYIGPEGGWTAAELNLAEKAGCTAVSLGPTTLRGETAAIIGSYLASQ